MQADPVGIYLRQKFNRPGLNRKILFLGMLLPLAFDMKKFDDSGSSLQVLLVAVSLMCASIYFAAEWLSRDIRASRSKLRSTTTLWWVYLAISPFPVLLWKVDPVHYLKVLLPFVLFGVGLIVMMAAERRRIDPGIMLDVLLWGCVVSTIWRVIYSVWVGGFSIETIRWQILGPGVPFLLGYGVAGLYVKRRRALAATALIIGLVVALLSITRSFVLSGALVLAGIMAVETRRRSALYAAGRGIRLFGFLAAIGAAAVALAIWFRPEMLDTWMGRLFAHRVEGGMDITLVTRLAEYRSQVDSMTRSLSTLLLGNGIGAEYTWDSRILKILPFESNATTHWFAGHSTWIYPFFASGIILGAVVPFVIFRAVLSAFNATAISAHGSLAWGPVTAFVIFLAYLGQSATANLFHERFAGLILGMLSGVALIYAGADSGKNRTDTVVRQCL